MKTLLLTGFGAYATTTDNPAEKVAEALDGAEIDQISIKSTIVPNAFNECILHVKNILNRYGSYSPPLAAFRL